MTIRAALQKLLLLALAMALPACDKGPSTPPEPGAKPGHLTGKLSDSQGKPLSNVTVRIFGFDTGGKVVKLEKKFPGLASEYDIEVPEGKYDTPTARIGLEYNERWYDLPLAAADGTREWTVQHESKQGMVRDFVWKIAGRVPGFDAYSPSAYWGGTIEFDLAAHIADIATVEITLTPTGPLIDGSAGKPVTLTRRIPWHRPEDHFLFDIPIGKYLASAKVLIGSTPKPLRLASYTIDPTNPEEHTPAKKLPLKVPVEFECQEVKKGEWKLLTPNLIALPPEE